MATYTTHFSFYKPDLRDGEENGLLWAAGMNANLDRIDARLSRRESVVITLGAATGTVDLGKSFRIEGEVASAAGRFRLYRTTAGRDADLARAAGTQEPTSVGLLLEDVFEAGALSIASIPAPGAPSGGTLCAWSWSGALGATVTLDVLKLEA